jgi:hypothetical protein
MKIFIAILFSVLSQAPAHAAELKSVPPEFDAQKWGALVAQAAKSTDAMDTESGQFRTLTKITPLDAGQPHQADYFSAVGYPDTESGNFSVMYLSAVSETWAIDANSNWDVDQWIYQLSTSGELTSLSHNHLVEEQDGRIVLYDGISTKGADDPGELQHWGVKLDEWERAGLSPQLSLSRSLRLK